MWQRLLIVSMLFSLTMATAQAAPSTPTTDFTDNGDGTATHKTTGLTWKRCAEGMTWSGSSCTGTAGYYSWAQATALTSTFAGNSDWRVPTIREMNTIIEYGDPSGGSLNSTIFPNNPSDTNFWSASAAVGNSSYAWYVSTQGLTGINKTTLPYYVRMVRGGQSLGLLNMGRPTSDYVDNGDGTATHTPTGLTWQRCQAGKTWTGSTCSGTAIKATVADTRAKTSTFAGKSDWRIPTEAELLSLADYLTGNVNSTIFPNPDTGVSIAANNSGANWAWGASSYGLGGFFDLTGSTTFPVRFVRGSGQTPAIISQPDCLFNWAEKTYPQYFSPAAGKTQTLDVYTYRQYGSTYLAVSSKDNHVWAILAGSMMDAGPASQWYATASCK